MARILTINEHTPAIDDDAWIAPDATVAGNVTLGAGTSVWFGCVVRSELEEVRIGTDTNVQDLTVVHADPGFPCAIGERVTVGHRAVLHGCTIGDDVLVGMGAVVLNGAVVGEGAVIGAGAVVTEGSRIPPRTVAVGIPAKSRDLQIPEIPRPNVAGYKHIRDWYREHDA